jgi:hypothetical protein
VRRNKVLAMLLLLAVGMTARAQSRGEAGAQIANPPIPKGAVHLVVRNDAEAKKVFTYFPYPHPPDWYHPDLSNPHPPDIGVYRIEVTPEGTVSAVTILKSANRMMDVISIKTFVRWRAKPGQLRVVDVPCSFGIKFVGTGGDIFY